MASEEMKPKVITKDAAKASALNWIHLPEHFHRI